MNYNHNWMTKFAKEGHIDILQNVSLRILLIELLNTIFDLLENKHNDKKFNINVTSSRLTKQITLRIYCYEPSHTMMYIGVIDKTEKCILFVNKRGFIITFYTELDINKLLDRGYITTTIEKVTTEIQTILS